MELITELKKSCSNKRVRTDVCFCNYEIGDNRFITNYENKKRKNQRFNYVKFLIKC